MSSPKAPHWGAAHLQVIDRGQRTAGLACQALCDDGQHQLLQAAVGGEALQALQARTFTHSRSMSGCRWKGAAPHKYKAAGGWSL